MSSWTQQEIETMRLADDEIERDFTMTLGEISESRERDNEVLDGQLDFRDLHRQQYQRAYNKRYYTKNKAYLNEKCRKYHAGNRSRENARSKEWREDNGEYCKIYHKAYYDEHREQILAKKQAQYEVNRAYKSIMKALEAEQ